MKHAIRLSLLAAGISGVSIFSNAVFVSKTDPLVFALVRNAIVAFLLTTLLVGKRLLPVLRGLTGRGWGALLLIGGIGGGIPFALFFTGLAEIGAVNGNVLQKTLFLWVALLAIPILKEKLTKLQLLGYAVLFSGMFLIGGTGAVIFKTGSGLVLAATILWAIENVIAKRVLKTVPPLLLAWGRITFGLPFLLTAVLLAGKGSLLVQPGTYALMPILASSILLVGYVSVWYRALAAGPATLVSSVLVVAPVVTTVLSSIFLHKPMTQPAVISNILLVLGIILVVSVGVRRQEKVAVTS